MEPSELQVSGNWLTDILVGQLGFNASKIDKTKLKSGLHLVLDSFEPAINTPANFDAAVIASIENLVDKWIDALKLTAPADPSKPLVVGASMPTITAMRSRKEGEAEILKQGGDPKQFAPFLLLLLQFAPTLIQVATMIAEWLKSRKPV